MPNLNDVMDALRNADESGNTKDAQKLAAIADKMRKTAEAVPKTATEDPMPFVLKGFAETLGSPVDAFTAGLNLIPGVNIKNPIGGSESLKTALRAYGFAIPKHKAKTALGRVAGTTGEVLGYVLPMGATTKILSKSAGLTGKITANIMKSMAEHPWISMASEVTGGVGAGVGREVGEQSFKSPTAKIAAEMAGGMAGGVAPTVIAHLSPTAVWLRTGKRILKKLTMPFTEKGSTYRAGKYLKGLVANPADVAQTVSHPTIGELPPAVASGEERLASLYRNFVSKDPVADADTIETLSNSIIKLEGEMRKLGYGSPELLADITEKRIAALELKMNNRIANAMASAQNKLDAIPVANRKAAEAKIVRGELEGVRHLEHEKTKILWRKVPKGHKVGVENTQQTYDSIKNDLAKAQRDDIPYVLKKSFIVKTGKKGERLAETTLKEMQGLRSKLQEAARLARKNGKWNKARIADEVSDAILKDIDVSSEGAVTPEAANLKAALASTREYKIRFESGIVGDLLGYSKSGVPRIDPELTLEKSLGMLSERGAVNVDKITVTPEAKTAVERYLGRSYVDYAASKGPINPVKSETWIKNNEAILDQFPGLRKQLTDATTAQEFADKTRIVMEARKARLRDPKISTSAKFLNTADLNKTVDTILKDKNPLKMTRELIRQTKKDPTGDALIGLRGAFVDYMMEKSAVGPFNKLGEHQLSGESLAKIIHKNKVILNELFTPEQMERLRKVTSELLKIDHYLKLSPRDPNIEMQDAASVGTTLLSRILGARLGGWMGRESAGGSLQMAQIFSGSAKKLVTYLNRDRALALIHDAILSNDPKLLKTLLLPLDKPDTKIKYLMLNVKKLNAWMAGVGKRVIDDIEQEEKE